MKPWLLFSLAAFFLWGFWAFLTKVATVTLPPKTVFFYELVAIAAVAVVLVPFLGWRHGGDSRGIAAALLAGASILIGEIAFVYAVGKGKASVVVTLTALYPIVGITLAFLVFRETVTLKQAAGIVLGLFSMALIAI